MEFNVGECYKKCNTKYPVSSPVERIFCKKGCDADEETLYNIIIILNIIENYVKQKNVWKFV